MTEAVFAVILCVGSIGLLWGLLKTLAWIWNAGRRAARPREVWPPLECKSIEEIPVLTRQVSLDEIRKLYPDKEHR